MSEPLRLAPRLRAHGPDEDLLACPCGVEDLEPVGVDFSDRRKTARGALTEIRLRCAAGCRLAVRFSHLEGSTFLSIADWRPGPGIAPRPIRLTTGSLAFGAA